MKDSKDFPFDEDFKGMTPVKHDLQTLNQPVSESLVEEIVFMLPNPNMSPSAYFKFLMRGD